MNLKYKYTLQIIPNKGSCKDIDALDKVIKSYKESEPTHIHNYDVITLDNFHCLVAEIILVMEEKNYIAFRNVLFYDIEGIKVIKFTKELIASTLPGILCVS